MCWLYCDWEPRPVPSIKLKARSEPRNGFWNLSRVEHPLLVKNHHQPKVANIAMFAYQCWAVLLFAHSASMAIFRLRKTAFSLRLIGAGVAWQSALKMMAQKKTPGGVWGP